jgi:hypothetical protein
VYVDTVGTNATPTPNIDSYDMHCLTVQFTPFTVGAPTGTPTHGQKFTMRIKDLGGFAVAIGWNAIYRAVGATLPTTTIVDKTLYVGFIYNSTDTKWDCVAVSQEV